MKPCRDSEQSHFQKRTKGLSQALNTINEIIHSTLDFDEIMQRVVSAAAQALDCETAAISLRDQDYWRVGYVYGFPEQVIGTRMNDHEEPHAVLAVKTGKPVVVNDAFNDERVNREHMKKWDIRSVLVVPLVTEDQAIGVLFFNQHKPRFTFNAFHVDFVNKLASTLSLALRNARLYERLQAELSERKRAEEALRRSRDDLEMRVQERTAEIWKQSQILQQQADLLEQSHEAIMISSLKDGRVSFWNRGAEEMYGWKKEEALDKNIDSILHTRFPAPLEEITREVLGKRKWSGELIHFRRDGEEVIVDSRWALQTDSNGQPVGIFEINSDITERKRADNARRAAATYARGLIEASLDPLVTISVDGKIMDVNRATEEVTGIPRERLIGSDFSDYFTEPEKAREGYRRVFKEGSVRNYPLAIRHTSGKATDVYYNATVYKDEAGELQGVFAAARDITERLRAEAALRLYTERLEASNRDLQDFAFVASHDMREPLRKIRTFGDMISKKFGNILPEEGNNYFRRMRDAAKRMDELLASLLTYSRISTRGSPLTSVNLTHLANDAASDLKVLIEEKGASVAIGNLPIAEVDPPQIRQLFGNLIQNGIKFNSSSHPEIEIYEETGGGGCRIFVRDNGIGFDERYLDRIFSPFQRLHGRSEYEGTGMGLAICRKIVERHGGSITAHSTPGKGSTFIITLRLKQHRGVLSDEQA